MTTFLYLGGKEFDETDLPPAVTMFGIKFIEEVPKTLTADMFKSTVAFDHAVLKLSAHQMFKKLDDSVQEVIETPKKSRGRPPKAPPEVAEYVNPIEDAAE